MNFNQCVLGSYLDRGDNKVVHDADPAAVDEGDDYDEDVDYVDVDSAECKMSFTFDCRADTKIKTRQKINSRQITLIREWQTRPRLLERSNSKRFNNQRVFK